MDLHSTLIFSELHLETRMHRMRNDVATLINNLLYYKNFLEPPVQELVDGDVKRLEILCEGFRKKIPAEILKMAFVQAGLLQGDRRDLQELHVSQEEPPALLLVFGEGLLELSKHFGKSSPFLLTHSEQRNSLLLQNSSGLDPEQTHRFFRDAVLSQQGGTIDARLLDLAWKLDVIAGGYGFGVKVEAQEEKGLSCQIEVPTQ